MGATHYITVTTREYALTQRMEGAVRALLRRAPHYGDETGPARAVLKETLEALDKQRNGGRPA